MSSGPRGRRGRRPIGLVGPVRTCVGCGRRRSAAELARLALTPGPQGPLIVADPRRIKPGRGAWVCADEPDCLAQASRKGRLARALKAPGAVLVGPAAAGPRKTEFCGSALIKG
ncbi:MAG: YlxR family protein [Deltaproteobacteria bacterium]|nr:YlxR family protein [Deltaproteobacteria bacterium]